ncbi:ERI1 exoribonuclease 2-like [Diadema antillarum]|uniref:ERI1 exoribonuclease 2-like n=1 Tax=Diadema antillarum TaxID=105358 RepID=UPI003A87F8BC
MKSTKELARELGLLRKRTASTLDKRKSKLPKNSPVTCQTFSYVVVIDFESTCWKDKKNSNQEIIEFPAVLLNTKTGQIEFEFHQYVMPDENPMLSEFCKEFTGISQEQVDNGVPLFVCLNQFNSWLKKIERDKSVVFNSSKDDAKNLCTFITWSDWDLGVCLHYECQRKQLCKPSTLNQWIDIRAVYRSFYKRRPQGLNGALQELGIQFAGRQHSGLDDARNTARLVWRMIQDGCLLSITKTIRSVGQGGKTTTVNPFIQSGGAGHHTGQPHNSTSVRPKSDTTVLCKSPKASRLCPDKPSEENTTPNPCPGTLSATDSSDHQLHQPPRTSSDVSVRESSCGGVNSSVTSKVTCKQGSLIREEVSHEGIGDIGGVEKRTPERGNIFENCKLKTPPVQCIPFFNQNSITKYGRLGVKTDEIPVFKTPCGSNSHLRKGSSENFRTPDTATTPKPCAKITPPMCKCGRRTKRRVAARPGPNQGRPFYSCPSRGRDSRPALGDATNVKWGCGYFCWESSVVSGLNSPLNSVSGVRLAASQQVGGKFRTPSPLAMSSITRSIKQRTGGNIMMLNTGGIPTIGTQQSAGSATLSGTLGILPPLSASFLLPLPKLSSEVLQQLTVLGKNHAQPHVLSFLTGRWSHCS